MLGSYYGVLFSKVFENLNSVVIELTWRYHVVLILCINYLEDPVERIPHFSDFCKIIKLGTKLRSSITPS